MKWISVKDRLPEQGVFVLVYRPDACFDKQKITRIGKTQFENAEWLFEGIERVTHWMPLPEPPVEFKATKENLESLVDAKVSGNHGNEFKEM